MSNNTFTRDDTAVLKGVAILMMLWLHLFHDAAWYSLSTTLVSVLGKPLVAWVSNATNPVYFFTFLSGYGLYLSYKKGKSDNFLRVKKLYFHYWFYTIVFVLIGFLLAKPGYPGGLVTILFNVTGWKTTYNGTIWFLFPYCLLALSSKRLFFFAEKCKYYGILIAIGCIYIVCLSVLHFWGEYLIAHQWAYMPEHYFELLCPFMLGYFCAKYVNVSVWRRKLGTGWKVAFLLVLSMGIMMFATSVLSVVLYPLYVSMFCLLFSIMKKPRWLSVFLKNMGETSTSIWFLHAYFCWYFIPEYIYYFKYPVLIFLILVVVSYATARLLDFVYNRIKPF